MSEFVSSSEPATRGDADALPPVIGIIGAGFSGTMTAIQLRRCLPEGRIHLFDGGAQFANGVAYGAASEDYLLNVRVSNMSGFPDDPGHFERWLSDWVSTTVDEQRSRVAGPFVERSVYGQYLRSLLSAEVERAPGLLHLDADRVVSLERPGARWRIGCAGGRTVDVDAVVIATGNLPPATPDDGVVFRNPWAPHVLDGLRPGEPVLIVGTGLTMVDLAQGLHATGFAGPVLAMSRRGLVPHRHAAPAPAWPCSEALVQPGLPLSALLHGFRQTVRDAVAQGVSWQAVIDGLRPVTTRLWKGWTVAEQARFLRHLRPYWDTHRHRLAPVVADRFDAMISEDQLQLHRGRLTGLVVRGGAAGPVAEVSIQKWGAACPDVLEVQRVIFATGAGSGMVGDPLLTKLIESGTARADGNGLGLEVTDGLRVVGREGSPAAGLWALGPAVRGVFWECTAVPDIRQQARQVAFGIASVLQVSDPAPSA